MENTATQTTLPSRMAQVEKWMPGLRAMRNYQRAWLPRDLIAGVVLVTLLVPQGMAYAELAGLPAITGLYTTVICLVAYALVGLSPVLVLGPDSSPQIKQAATTPVWVLITAEPMTDVDTTAAEMLTDLDLELNAAGMHLVFAELKDPVQDKIVRFGLLETIDRRHFYPTIEMAVEAFHQEVKPGSF